MGVTQFFITTIVDHGYLSKLKFWSISWLSAQNIEHLGTNCRWMLNKLSLFRMLISGGWITIKFILYLLSKRWSIFWSNITSMSRIMLALLHNLSSKKGLFFPLACNAAYSIYWALNLLSFSLLCIQLICCIEASRALFCIENLFINVCKQSEPTNLTKSNLSLPKST